jgi:hypothetical protein
MKKSKDYAPYLFAFLITVIAVVTQNLFLKPGILFRSIVYFSVIVGMWRWIEWLLTHSENKLVQCYSIKNLPKYSYFNRFK